MAKEKVISLKKKYNEVGKNLNTKIESIEIKTSEQIEKEARDKNQVEFDPTASYKENKASIIAAEKAYNIDVKNQNKENNKNMRKIRLLGVAQKIYSIPKDIYTTLKNKLISDKSINEEQVVQSAMAR